MKEQALILMKFTCNVFLEIQISLKVDSRKYILRDILETIRYRKKIQLRKELRELLKKYIGQKM